MKPSSHAEWTRMAPLLVAIAREIAERTLVITKLERLSPSKTVRLSQSAVLATHRKELRLALDELGRLGWERDPDRPLRFRRVGAAGVGGHWAPDGTAFYNSLDLGTAWS